MSTRYVINLNNRTLTFLQQQEFELAIESSTRAMEIFQPFADVVVSRPIFISLDRCILRSPVDHPGEPSSTPQTFIYKQGMPLPQDTNDLTMAIPILVFNSALAHHLHATQQQQQPQDQQSSNRLLSRLLRKAKTLYQLAHSLAVVDVDVLFHFVVMNNIAVIDRNLGRAMLSNASFYYLQARYLILMHQEENERLRHLRGFWMNFR